MSQIDMHRGIGVVRAPSFAPGSYEQDRSLRREGKVLPEQARRHNRALVLRTLFHEGAMSRADLARETSLTRVTISDLVGDLIDDTYIVELGIRAASGPGKPAMLVDLNRTGHSIIALDVSRADVLAGALMNVDGTMVERRERDIPPHPDDVLDALIALARDLIVESTVPILGVGVGTPGVVTDEGVVLNAPNVGWLNLDLRTQLEDALRLPVIVGNDANAAVLAEYTFSEAGEDIMLVKVDRGVGAGLLSAGMPLRGGRSAAGEIGHVTVGANDGPACVCGKNGCLEAWISVPALTERMQDVADSDMVLREAGRRLGAAIAPIIGALDLSEIVLAGPEDLLAGSFMKAVDDTVHDRMLDDNAPIHIRMSEHGRDSVLMGATVKVLAGRLGVS